MALFRRSHFISLMAFIRSSYLFHNGIYPSSYLFLNGSFHNDKSTWMGGVSHGHWLLKRSDQSNNSANTDPIIRCTPLKLRPAIQGIAEGVKSSEQLQNRLDEFLKSKTVIGFCGGGCGLTVEWVAPWLQDSEFDSRLSQSICSWAGHWIPGCSWWLCRHPVW